MSSKRKEILDESLDLEECRRLGNGDTLFFIEESLVKSAIDDIESEVNEAKDYLTSISGISDLDKVQDCLDVLEKLSQNLY